MEFMKMYEAEILILPSTHGGIIWFVDYQCTFATSDFHYLSNLLKAFRSHTMSYTLVLMDHPFPYVFP